MRFRPAFVAALALLPLASCQPSSGRFGDDDDDDDDDSWADDDAADDDGTDDDVADDDASSFAIDTSAVGPGFLLQSYSGLLVATGGAIEPVVFTLGEGSLPPALTLDSGGLIGGTPTDFGVWQFTVAALDASGASAAAAVELVIDFDPAEIYLGAVPADGEYNNMCDDSSPSLHQLCHPWVRLAGTGIEQTVRALLPALVHVGADGEADDLTRGLGDDVVVRLLEPTSVTWEFEPLVGDTAQHIDISPTDTTIDDVGVITAGEEAGPGQVRLDSEEWGEGLTPTHVVAPDWCPEPRC
ncbi:putative Ig domain-containing protein [Myxococcota bacterium]|nr:putative Ig domain-containing protein [Myxococcota bacterium]